MNSRACCVVVAVCLSPITALAEPSAARDLAGQELLVPALIPSTLTTTYIGGRAAVEQARRSHIQIGNNSRVVRELVAAESFDLSIGLGETVALLASGLGRGSVGMNGTSLILRGASFELGGLLGARWRALRLEDTGTQLALQIEGGYSKARFATLSTLIGNLVTTPAASVEEVAVGNGRKLIATPARQWTAFGSINLAQVVSPAFSLQMSAGLRYRNIRLQPFSAQLGSRFDVERDVLTPEFGAALTGDGTALGLPLALLGEYRLAIDGLKRPSDRRWEATNSFLLGLYYTGKSYLQLGVNAFLALAPSISPNEPRLPFVTREVDHQDYGAGLVLLVFL